MDQAATDLSSFDSWKQALDVQKHFNDILFRIRGLAFAFGGAAVAFAMARPEAPAALSSWRGLGRGLAAPWIALYLMDRAYYHELLRASVRFAEDIEARGQGARALHRDHGREPQDRLGPGEDHDLLLAATRGPGVCLYGPLDRLALLCGAVPDGGDSRAPAWPLTVVIGQPPPAPLVTATAGAFSAPGAMGFSASPPWSPSPALSASRRATSSEDSHYPPQVDWLPHTAHLAS